MKLSLDEYAAIDGHQDYYSRCYAMSCYRKYKKLTPDQEERIRKLKKQVGKIIKYKFRGKVKDYTVMAVMLKPKDRVGPYSSYPYDFRLRPSAWPDREEFWTMNIDNVVK